MAKQVTKKAVVAKAPAKSATNGTKSRIKAAAKPMDNRKLQQNAMDKIATYSKAASRGEWGVNNSYKSRGVIVSPTDSVIKYSSELKKLQKKK